MSVLDTARHLNSLGYAIFPVVHGMKIPATTRGFLDASTDPQQVERWFSASRKNIGIATGDASQLVVIDFDAYKPEAMENFADLVLSLGQLPKTFSVATRAGGLHLYFRKPPGFDLRSYNNMLALGVDVRGNGGYVLSQGCFVRADDRGPQGDYGVKDDLPVAELPAEWAKAWRDLNIPTDLKLAKQAEKAAQLLLARL